MYHIFFTHASVDGHLGFFHVLAIVNSATMNTGTHVSFRIVNIKELLKRMPNCPKPVYFSIFLPDFLQHDLLFSISPIFVKSYFWLKKWVRSGPHVTKQSELTITHHLVIRCPNSKPHLANSPLKVYLFFFNFILFLNFT